MSRELICSILKVPPEPWPPNHYTLLGISTSEIDPARLEARASELSALLRTYQLSYPEPVTEALNRIAQALVCLQDPRARAEYDAQLTGNRSAASRSPVAPRRERNHADPRREPYRILAFGRKWLDGWMQLERWMGESRAQLHDRRDAAALMAAVGNLRELAKHQYAILFLDETTPGATVMQLVRRRRTLHSWRKLSTDQKRLLAADWSAAANAFRRESRRRRQRIPKRRQPCQTMRRWTRYYVGDGLDLAIVVLALVAVAIALVRNRY